MYDLVCFTTATEYQQVTKYTIVGLWNLWLYPGLCTKRNHELDDDGRRYDDSNDFSRSPWTSYCHCLPSPRLSLYTASWRTVYCLWPLAWHVILLSVFAVAAGEDLVQSPAVTRKAQHLATNANRGALITETHWLDKLKGINLSEC